MFLFLALCLGHFANATFETPALEVTSYRSLQLSLPKAKVQWAVQRAVDRLYGVAYSDLGDMSDFMHGHLFLGRPSVLLFHTKEYGFLRKGRPYRGPHGELDPDHQRNYLLLMEDSTLGPAGEVVEAHPYSSVAGREDVTVAIRDLDPQRFTAIDGDNDESFYFFRVSCKAADQAQQSFNSRDEDNLIEVLQGSRRERVCLALVSFHCRNQWERDSQCRDEQVLAPYSVPESQPLYSALK